MNRLHSALHTNINMYAGKRIFLRADLNVPCILKNNISTIIDDFRLITLLPTIDLLLANHCTIVLATHRERPKKYDPALSTQVLMPWFTKRGYPIIHEPHLDRAQKTIAENPGNIILLENLRFYAGEQSKNKEDREHFAHTLAALADCYVNDAFGSIHRTDTSLIELAYLFDTTRRTIGLLIERELNAIDTLLHNPKKPFLLIMGGGKSADKLSMITQLFELVDIIAPMPTLSSTFMAALGQQTGKSLITDNYIKTIRSLVQRIKESNKQLIMPIDYVVAQESLQNPLRIIEANAFQSNDVSVTLGPRSVAQLQKICAQAGTIVMNGMPGLLERQETIEPLKPLFESIAHSNAYTMLGGGQSIAAARLFKVVQLINHCSTGGGALLACLSTKTLPALYPFNICA